MYDKGKLQLEAYAHWGVRSIQPGQIEGQSRNPKYKSGISCDDYPSWRLNHSHAYLDSVLGKLHACQLMFHKRCDLKRKANMECSVLLSPIVITIDKAKFDAQDGSRKRAGDGKWRREARRLLYPL